MVDRNSRRPVARRRALLASLLIRKHACLHTGEQRLAFGVINQTIEDLALGWRRLTDPGDGAWRRDDPAALYAEAVQFFTSSPTGELFLTALGLDRAWCCEVLVTLDLLDPELLAAHPVPGPAWAGARGPEVRPCA